MKYYLLSLKWTNPNDLLFTFWKAGAHGYSWMKHEYGIFNPEGADTFTDNPHGIIKTVFKVEKSKVDELCVPILFEGRSLHALPVNEYTLQELGLTSEELYQKHRSDFSGVEFVLNTQQTIK